LDSTPPLGLVEIGQLFKLDWILPHPWDW
jgi:hypothetical protein